jgi:hypothetical protein
LSCCFDPRLGIDKTRKQHPHDERKLESAIFPGIRLARDLRHEIRHDIGKVERHFRFPQRIGRLDGFGQPAVEAVGEFAQPVRKAGMMAGDAIGKHFRHQLVRNTLRFGGQLHQDLRPRRRVVDPYIRAVQPLLEACRIFAEVVEQAGEEGCLFQPEGDRHFRGQSGDGQKMIREELPIAFVWIFSGMSKIAHAKVFSAFKVDLQSFPNFT